MMSRVISFDQRPAARRRDTIARGLALIAILAALIATSLAGGWRHASSTTGIHPLMSHPIHVASVATQLPTTSECVADFGIHCYTPAQYDLAYNLNGLHAAGIDGTGRTIVIVDAFGSPTIKDDVHSFDQEFGLPDPNITIIQPAGPVPPFDPNDSDMFGWSIETTLDVEWAHAMAPGANILLVETPVSETEGVQGFPEIVKAENYVINHHLGDVISQSFGATEDTFPSKASIYNLRSAYYNAAFHGVTVLGASGDAGATDYDVNGDLFTHRVNSWPSSDPLVTSVGGTQLNLDDTGNRLSPDVVWNDGYGAGGGGVSSVFSRPDFQDRVRSVVHGRRGTPDISLSAAVDGAAWVYLSSNPDPAFVGWWLVGGTSEASPLFAGIVAMADQLAGHRAGFINDDLYAMLQNGHRSGIVDVTSGNNSFGPFTNSDGQTYTVTGYDAGPGYDLASGVGTIDGARFVRQLARSAGWGN
jgi:subtilase family serine protease